MSSALKTTCCIVGGGPAGIMLGYLLARKGVHVTVLEKHKDFFRDFRGDTVHPSMLEVMYELGILQDLLRVPHQKLTSVGGVFGDFAFKAADFTRVPTHCKFVALMPQWDFLDFLSGRPSSIRLRAAHGARNCGSDSRFWRHLRVKAKTPAGEAKFTPTLWSAAMEDIPLFGRSGRTRVQSLSTRCALVSHRPALKRSRAIAGNINYGKLWC